MADYVREIVRTRHVPEALAGPCALGILAASLGAGIELRGNAAKITRGNLYVMVLAPSGCGKSETLKELQRPFADLESERLQQWKQNVAPKARAEEKVLRQEIKTIERSMKESDRESALESLAAKETELLQVTERLKSPRLCVDDVSTEQLALLLSANGEALASISADARKVIDNVLGRYQKGPRTDEDIYLKAFSGDECRVDRVSREPVYLRRPCLSTLWLVQPDKFDQLSASQSLVESGFLARLLVCHVECQPQLLASEEEPEISPTVASEYRDQIRLLINTFRLAAEPVTVDVLPESKAALRDHYNDIITRHNGGETKDINSFVLRWNEQACRIAVGLHAGLHGSAACDEPVALSTVRSAIRLADWFARQQLELLAGSRSANKEALQDKLLDLIGSDPTGLGERELQRRFHLKTAIVRPLLLGLIAEGKITSESKTPETGGHRQKIYKVKPQ